MQRFALINDKDQVENVIVAEAGYQHLLWETIALAEGQYCQIGWFYDRNSGTFRSFKPLPLEQARQAKLEYLQQQVDLAILSGFTSSALGNPHFYDSKLHDQANLSSAIEILRYAPEGSTVGFICIEVSSGVKEMRPHTLSQFQTVLMDGAMVNLAAREQYRTLVNQVNQAENSAAIEVIVWQ